MSTPLATALDQALARATAVVSALDPQELDDLAAGRGLLVYRPAEPVPAVATAGLGPRCGSHRAARHEASRRTLGIDIAAVVAEINSFDAPGDVAAYLGGLDARFTVPVLREIARTIGPTVTATGRTKAQLQRDIVEGTVGFRVRTAAMSGGAWA